MAVHAARLIGIQAVQGSLIAYATAPGAVALDGSGRNGLYTAALLQHLTTPDLSVEQLFKRVRATCRRDKWPADPLGVVLAAR